MSEKKKSSIFGDTYIKTKNGEIVIRSGLKLIICWIIFAVLCLLYVYTFFFDKTALYPGKDNTVDFDVPEGASYEKCEIDGINSLIEGYLNARVLCDQETLQSLVTDPSEFDDMTIYEKASLYLRGFNNITNYIAAGYQEGEYIVITLSNLSIANVEVQPLDIRVFYVVMDSTGAYKIFNGETSEETAAYINDFISSDDYMAIYNHASENVEYYLETDESFKEFYDLLY